MSDTISSIQQSRPVTQTRNRVRKTIDYANTAQLSSYSGNQGELILNTDTSAISYINGSNVPATFAVATIVSSNSALLPVASASNRGHIYTAGAGTANDAAYICVYTGTTSQTYVWKTLSFA